MQKGRGRWVALRPRPDYGPRPPDRWPSGRRRAPGKCVYVKSVSWVRIPPCPPVPMRATLSARPTAALSGRFPGVFGANLLTGPARRSPEFALRSPFLSGPPDLAIFVRTRMSRNNNQLRARSSHGIRPALGTQVTLALQSVRLFARPHSQFARPMTRLPALSTRISSARDIDRTYDVEPPSVNG